MLNRVRTIIAPDNQKTTHNETFQDHGVCDKVASDANEVDITEEVAFKFERASVETVSGVSEVGGGAMNGPGLAENRSSFDSDNLASEISSIAATTSAVELPKNVWRICLRADVLAWSGGTVGLNTYRGPSALWSTCPFSSSKRSGARMDEYGGGSDISFSTSAVVALPRR